MQGVADKEKETAQMTVPCSHPGCVRSGYRVVGDSIVFKVRHDGHKHEVVISLETLVDLLAGVVSQKEEA